MTELANLSEMKLNALLDDVADINWLEEAFRKNEDEFVRLAIVERMMEINKREGGKLALEMLNESTPLFLREQLCTLMKDNFGQDFGYQTDRDPADPQNRKAIEAWEKWLRK